MLPFLREQGGDKLSGQKPNFNAGKIGFEAAENAQAQGGSQEYYTVAARSKNVRKSTILVTILFGIGLLCLLFMIKKSTPQTASASPDDEQETQIEVAIARLTGVSSEMFSRMDQIVNKFYEFSDVLQVQVNESQKTIHKRIISIMMQKRSDNSR